MRDLLNTYERIDISVKEILDKTKIADFTHEVNLTFNGKREIFTFLGIMHHDKIYYYIESEMILRSFEHWTATTCQNNFFFICKGFIAGLMQCSEEKLKY